MDNLQVGDEIKMKGRVMEVQGSQVRVEVLEASGSTYTAWVNLEKIEKIEKIPTPARATSVPSSGYSRTEDRSAVSPSSSAVSSTMPASGDPADETTIRQACSDVLSSAHASAPVLKDLLTAVVTNVATHR